MLLRDLTVHGDRRGRVFEGWRVEWTDWPVKQLTEARAAAGVLKGLHLHYRQWDWWRCVSGRMRVGLYDARPGSPTHGVASTLEMTSDAPSALAIPPGVAHGFYALSDLEMIYLLSEVYDPGDEHGLRWNTAGIEWGVGDAVPAATGEPILSARDLALPPLDEFVWQGGAP